MTYNLAEVREQALSMLDGNEPDGALLDILCAAAATELEARLKDKVSVETLGITFTKACGVLALSLYAEIGGTGSAVESVSAGEISVRYEGAQSRALSATALRKLAESLLYANLEDRGFQFKGVIS